MELGKDIIIANLQLGKTILLYNFVQHNNFYLFNELFIATNIIIISILCMYFMIVETLVIMFQLIYILHNTMNSLKMPLST